MTLDVVLLDVHEAELRSLLTTPNDVEASAYLLFGYSEIACDPWTGLARARLISHCVIPIAPKDAISASALHVTWSTRGFVRELARATEDNLVLGIVHTHPKGTAQFSSQDDRNEAELARAVANRNGDFGRMASLLLGGDGSIAARLWDGHGRREDAQRIVVSGPHFRSHGRLDTDTADVEILDRQARLFGPGFNEVLRDLRIGVVGCGGTGSPVAMLLTRLGVGHLALIDADVVELSNLNRIHGARRSDAVNSVPKVEVLAREIALADLGTKVVAVRTWTSAPEAKDVLKSCDIVFGCTDDHDGRMLLNRLAYFYGIPLIDVGLRIRPASAPLPFNLVGRISVICPGHSCLLCRGLVDPKRASDEDLERKNPAEHARRKAEAYVDGSGDPAPAVVTFTTESAAMAVNELIQALTGFQGEAGMVPGRFRQFETSLDRRVNPSGRAGCRVCDRRELWGRGDVEPFLHRVG